MKSWAFNQRPLSLGASFPQPTEEDLPQTLFKNADIHHVLNNTTDYVRRVIQSVSLQKKHKYVVVDVKVHDIEPGKYPCIPGWHCDSVVDPRQKTKPEVHNIFVTGYASLTEFIDQKIELQLDLEGTALLASFRRQIDEISPKICSVPSCQMVQYGRFDFHRGSIGKAAERRLLIRVSETDLIPPCNKPQNFNTF